MEHCEVHGQFYGTSTSQVKSIIAKGKICLFDIDQQGA
jgi:guanylate kinase